MPGASTPSRGSLFGRVAGSHFFSRASLLCSFSTGLGLSPLRFPFSSLVRASLSRLLFGSVVQRVIAGCSFRAWGHGIPLEKYYFLASRRGLPSLSISLAIESSLAYIAERDAASRPRLNFVVQHLLGLKEALIGCFVAMSFSWSVVEVFGD